MLCVRLKMMFCFIPFVVTQLVFMSLFFTWCVVHVFVLHVGCSSCGLVCVWVVLHGCGLHVVVVGCVWVHSVRDQTVGLRVCVVRVVCCSCVRSSGGLIFLCVFFIWFVFVWLL